MPFDEGHVISANLTIMILHISVLIVGRVLPLQKQEVDAARHVPNADKQLVSLWTVELFMKSIVAPEFSNAERSRFVEGTALKLFLRRAKAKGPSIMRNAGPLTFISKITRRPWPMLAFCGTSPNLHRQREPGNSSLIPCVRSGTWCSPQQWKQSAPWVGRKILPSKQPSNISLRRHPKNHEAQHRSVQCSPCYS